MYVPVWFALFCEVERITRSTPLFTSFYFSAYIRSHSGKRSRKVSQSSG